MTDRYKLIKTADGINTIYSEKYRETFHSEHGVLQEAAHVFLSGCAIQQLLQQQESVSILEIGFGTGFNFLLTAAAALNFSVELHFTSLEKELLSLAIYRQLRYDEVETISAVYPPFFNWRQNLTLLKTPDSYTFNFQNIHLNLIVNDALNYSRPAHRFDAVYLDAFSPQHNPELWTEQFLTKIKGMMREGAVLSTYSAKGSVRRAMLAAGFYVEKQDGPPGKREMLVAVNRPL